MHADPYLLINLDFVLVQPVQNWYLYHCDAFVHILQQQVLTIETAVLDFVGKCLFSTH